MVTNARCFVLATCETLPWLLILTRKEGVRYTTNNGNMKMLLARRGFLKSPWVRIPQTHTNKTVLILLKYNSHAMKFIFLKCTVQ